MTTKAPTIFLAGDVMTGRGVDQILRRPSKPVLYEPAIGDARGYVELAEEHSGPIPRGVEDEYIWGDALAELERAAPDARIVNLETSITTSEDAWPKGINYRMHPDNVGCLTAAKIDVCVLANNHVLDWGEPGLLETLDVLRGAGVRTAGAGRNLEEAQRPARVGNLLVFGIGSSSSGVPRRWAAQADRPGVDLVPALSADAAAAILARTARARRAGDLVIVSIHWGSNWGYEVPAEQIRFAHWLIDGGVDLVHGHSSHHPRPLEVYRGKLILYGCGDFVSDYEGITGYEEYRDDLVVMYLAELGAAGELVQLRMVPFLLRKLSLHRATANDVRWLAATLDRVSRPFGARVLHAPDATLHLVAGSPTCISPAP